MHRHQRGERLPAVAARVLLPRRQLRRGDLQALGDEDRVVAEAVVAALLADHGCPATRRSSTCSVPSGSTSAAAHTNAAPRRSSGTSASWPSSSAVFAVVVPVPARPAGRQDAGHAVERVDGEPRVVRDGRQAGVPDRLARLEQRVLRERRPRLGRLRVLLDVREAHDLHTGDGGDQQPPQLGELARVAGGQQQPRGHRASAAACMRVSSAQPVTARSSSASRVGRSNTAPSAVPCTSTKLPSPVQTTFMSVPARTSSS